MNSKKLLDYPVNYKKFRNLFLKYNLTWTERMVDRTVWALTNLKIVCLMDDDIILISNNGFFPKNDQRYILLYYLKHYIKKQQEK